ncbi:MAG: zf-HC2 domain-containing protein [Deltaproteobacteria bacterium]|nr:zf-HC2 domain-containing protein [Deltaproteobacteria bacterium]
MALDCTHIDELLLDYLYEELAPAERQEVEAHLAGCPKCAEQVAGFQRTRAKVRDLEEVEPPRGVSALLLEEAEKAARPRAVGLGARLRGFFQLLVLHPAMAAAVTLVAVLGVSFYVYQQGLPGSKQPDVDPLTLEGRVEKLAAKQEPAAGAPAAATSPSTEGGEKNVAAAEGENAPAGAAAVARKEDQAEGEGEKDRSGALGGLSSGDGRRGHAAPKSPAVARRARGRKTVDDLVSRGPAPRDDAPLYAKAKDGTKGQGAAPAEPKGSPPKAEPRPAPARELPSQRRVAEQAPAPKPMGGASGAANARQEAPEAQAAPTVAARPRLQPPVMTPQASSASSLRQQAQRQARNIGDVGSGKTGVWGNTKPRSVAAAPRPAPPPAPGSRSLDGYRGGAGAAGAKASQDADEERGESARRADRPSGADKKEAAAKAAPAKKVAERRASFVALGDQAVAQGRCALALEHYSRALKEQPGLLTSVTVRLGRCVADLRKARAKFPQLAKLVEAQLEAEARRASRAKARAPSESKAGVKAAVKAKAKAKAKAGKAAGEAADAYKSAE